MPRLVSFLIFFTIFLSVLGGAHYYVWARLVRDPALPAQLSRVLTWAMVALFASIPATFLSGRLLGVRAGGMLAWVPFVWMGMLFLSLVVVAGLDLVRAGWLLVRAAGDASPIDPERRLWFSRAFAGAAGLLVSGLGLAAVRSGLSRVLAREVRVDLERLPSELDGVTIAQLTDVHVGPTIQRSFVEQIVESTNALNPDVIAITGDLVDGSVEELRDHVAPLARLRARYGVYFVTGNHEYYSGVEEWCRELTRLGIRVLRNERVTIGVGEASFDLAGVDDYQARSFGEDHGPNLGRATAGRDPSRELVLLAHQPRAVFEAQHHGVGLQLSGHTHGGQLFPWNFMVRLQQPVVSGLARFGRTLLYVSNGTGYWGPPMRLGAPAEITRLVLRAPAEAVA
ncbi:MAG TPA: metallophosphoesterase [Polyangiaceae bacterium]|nr:metallophosphoesterase [Polyangiaceae bacterium]